MVSTVAPESTLRFRKGQNEMTFASRDQFIPLLHGQAFKNGRYQGEVVFVGYGIEEPEEGWNDYENMDVSGRIALMVSGTPTKDGRPVLSEEKNKLHGNLMESGRKRLLWAINHRAAGVIMVLDSTAAKLWPQVAAMGERPARRLKADEKKDQTHYLPVFFVHPEAAVELLKETGFNPVSGKGKVKSAQLKDTSIIFDLKYKIERDFVCQNTAIPFPTLFWEYLRTI